MKQFLIAIDQLVNTCVYEKTENGIRVWGYADEALSSRAYRLKDKGWYQAYKNINALFFWQYDHCKEAYKSEMLRNQLPVEYR